MPTDDRGKIENFLAFDELPVTQIGTSAYWTKQISGVFMPFETKCCPSRRKEKAEIWHWDRRKFPRGKAGARAAADETARALRVLRIGGPLVPHATFRP